MHHNNSDSHFYMWRAVFAMAYADGSLALEEQGLLYDYLDTVPFSDEQLEILREDVATPQDVDEMFLRVTEPEDRRIFFEMARTLVWCDGDYDAQEKVIIERLKRLADTQGDDYLEELNISNDNSSGDFLKDLRSSYENGGLAAILKKIVSGDRGR
jgi:hypothetical protein